MRKITESMRAVIEANAQPDWPSKSLPDLLVAAALTLRGITAFSDDGLVNEMRSTITKPWNEAWCVDFVQTCIAYVEAARGVLSPLPPTEGVLDLWNKAPVTQKITAPQVGDVIIWRLGQTLEGHCGIITGLDSLMYYTIEGNTSEAPGIVRDGNGVFAKKRAKGGTKTFTEVGFLRVFP